MELVLSRRNARLAFARGGRRERRGRTTAVMAAFHTLFLRRLRAGGGAAPPARSRSAGLARARASRSAAQALRYWAIATLGWRWNTRIDRGPGRSAGDRRARTASCGIPTTWRSSLEMVCVPLVHGAWLTAVAFTLGNACCSGCASAPRSGRSASRGSTPSPDAPVRPWSSRWPLSRRSWRHPQHRRATSWSMRARRRARATTCSATSQLDSLGLTVLAVGLENRFRVKLSEEDAAGVRTVADLARCVRRARRRRRA